MAIDGLDDEVLARREAFLVKRARTHSERGEADERHRQCAATLLRDAGCVALLGEQTESARLHLMAAGSEFLGLGAACGAALFALAATPAEWTQAIEKRDEVARRFFPTVDEEGVAPTSPMDPREILSFAQADLLIAARDGGENSRLRRVADMQTRDNDAEVGEIGLTVAEYLDMGARGVAGTVSRDSLRNWLASVWARRRRDIDRAAADVYHWRLLPRPAELLELDSVILLTILLRAGVDGIGDAEGLVGAPLPSARKLAFLRR